MRRVVFVLASGIAFVFALLGVAFLDSHGGLAQAAQTGTCPPGSTYEKVAGFPPVCANEVDGTPGNDVLVGSKNTGITDKMYARGGNDQLYGYAGDDGMSGGDGQDTIRGGQGNDGLFGDPGRDKIYGGPGDEEIHAYEGGDTVYGGPGDDEVNAGDGDTVYGGPGDDEVNAGDGKRDIIFCGSGHRDVANVDKRDVTESCELESASLKTGRSFWELFMCGTCGYARQFAGRLTD